MWERLHIAGLPLILFLLFLICSLRSFSSYSSSSSSSFLPILFILSSSFFLSISTFVLERSVDKILLETRFLSKRPNCKNILFFRGPCSQFLNTEAVERDPTIVVLIKSVRKISRAAALPVPKSRGVESIMGERGNKNRGVLS